MKVVVICGKTAVGRLTVAPELARITDGSLFLNPLTVKRALFLFDFGSPGRVEPRGRNDKLGSSGQLADLRKSLGK